MSITWGHYAVQNSEIRITPEDDAIIYKGWHLFSLSLARRLSVARGGLFCHSHIGPLHYARILWLVFFWGENGDWVDIEPHEAP